MARVRSTDTGPELVVRRLVRKLGFRFSQYAKQLPGTPDLAFPTLRRAIFVHGCFWHGHVRCAYGRLPKSRLRYWRPKIESNRRRDLRVRRALRVQDWKSLVIWQCRTRDEEVLLHQIRDFLERDAPRAARIGRSFSTRTSA